MVETPRPTQQLLATATVPAVPPALPVNTATPAPAAPTATARAGASPTVATAQGAALVQERCSVCHTLDRVLASKRTEAQWRTVVEQMIRNGARLTPEEKEIVIKYLAATYHP